jgi:excinuclease ABC subunit B
MDFRLESPMVPRGDQPRAIEQLKERIDRGDPISTLMGVTGSGKTFTMAEVIRRLNRPTLVISHNKTLAAQLFAEFREFFPNNAVHYFVSYYDYYQPEAYIPQRDIYIEKDADINQDIDRLRLATTSALMSRRDVIVVASVSCIYGLGSPDDYRAMIVPVRKGSELGRQKFLRNLIDLQYERNNVHVTRGKFRVRGEMIEVAPSYQDTSIRIHFDGDLVVKIEEIHPTTGDPVRTFEEFVIYPAKHFVMSEEKIERALESIEIELNDRLELFQAEGRLLEAQRLSARVRYDLELLREIGYCKGIENYSRPLSGRKEGEPPASLIDYFPDDFLCFVDESHVTLPQIRGMYRGDRSRKETLVEHGFRLPSALDNRPLTFEEWREKTPQVVCVSATPGPLELEACAGDVVEQVIRPTGLVDPPIEVRSARGQVPDLVKEIGLRVERNERVLVTTLTKRLAEDLADYLEERKIRSRYLHSEVQTIERVEILRLLREGKFDVLVGVNLLREGLDLPEVSLVAILDADKEGFLRSETALIQTVGRTARNVNGRVILYADRVTGSMRRAMDETDRRRKLQLAFNEENGITPTTIRKAIRKGVEELIRAKKITADVVRMDMTRLERGEKVFELEKEMHVAAEALEFEEAARLRDRIRELQGEGSAPSKKKRKSRRRR